MAGVGIQEITLRPSISLVVNYARDLTSDNVFLALYYDELYTTFKIYTSKSMIV